MPNPSQIIRAEDSTVASSARRSICSCMSREYLILCVDGNDSLCICCSKLNDISEVHVTISSLKTLYQA